MIKYRYFLLFLGLADLSFAQTPFRVAGFYSPEALFARQYEPADIPADELTHLFYAFVVPRDLNGDGYYEATWANLEVVQRTMFSRSLVPRDTLRIDRRGVLRQLVFLKRKYPHLRILLSVGGACSYDAMAGECIALHERFVQITKDAAHRERFVASLMQLFTNPLSDGSGQRLFDGIDVDWEFPGAGEKKVFVAFMRELRNKLDEMGSGRRERYLLTFDGPATTYFLQHYDVRALAGIVDWVNVMAYLYHMPQAWNPHTGHNAPFAGNAEDGHGKGYNIQEMSVAAWLNAGMPPEKIVLGVPYFGVGYTGVKPGKKEKLPGLHQPYHGPLVPGGEVPYDDLWGVAEPYRNAVLYEDEFSKAAFLYNRSKKVWISLETPESLFLKTQWAKSKGLGGIFAWELSQETMGGSGQAPLTRTIGWAARKEGYSLPSQGVSFEDCPENRAVRCAVNLFLHQPTWVQVSHKTEKGVAILQVLKRLPPGAYRYSWEHSLAVPKSSIIEVMLEAQKQEFVVN